MSTAVTRGREAERAEDLWPHTGRAAPWLLALFIAVLFVAVNLGVDIHYTALKPRISRS